MVITYLYKGINLYISIINPHIYANYLPPIFLIFHVWPCCSGYKERTSQMNTVNYICNKLYLFYNIFLCFHTFQPKIDSSPQS